MWGTPDLDHDESMDVIEVSGVEKAYGDHRVLTGVDLRIERGEVFSLLGPNGAGKTTLVEILEGYRTADAGSVRVLGADPSSVGPAFRSRIGIVLQQTTSFQRLTVRETVSMFAALFPDPLGVDEAIDLVGLSDRADAVADTMSGGQRRRLDVACGLVGRPELLFLDEPSTGLDPEARRAMWQVIKRLRSQGTTVLLTTHYLEEAEELADRIGILLDGQLRAVGPPDRIEDRQDAVATVRFDEPTDRPLDSSRWQAMGARLESGTVSIETQVPGQLIAGLVGEFGELGHLTVTRPSLEEIYLDLVESHTQQRAPQDRSANDGMELSS